MSLHDDERLSLRDFGLSKTEQEKRQKDQGSRLKQARVRMGYNSASVASRHLKIAGPTYLAHENGGRKIRPDLAEVYADHYGINLKWLLEGSGPMMAGEQESQSSDYLDLKQSPPALHAEELKTLLSVLNATICDETGQLVSRDRSNKLVDLPRFSGHIHYLPVLGAPKEGSDHPLIQLDHGDTTISLAVRSIEPVNMLAQENEQLFSVHTFDDAFGIRDTRSALPIFKKTKFHRFLAPTLSLAVDNDLFMIVSCEGNRQNDVLLKFSDHPSEPRTPYSKMADFILIGEWVRFGQENYGLHSHYSHDAQSA